uniref:Uncharacterized protein n=2 Tax=Halomonas sp. 40 TaxID=223901 RepID=A0A090AQR6_9GAMM|nr:hypothetical protein [Halomonas sp. 40]
MAVATETHWGPPGFAVGRWGQAPTADRPLGWPVRCAGARLGSGSPNPRQGLGGSPWTGSPHSLRERFPAIAYGAGKRPAYAAQRQAVADGGLIQYEQSVMAQEDAMRRMVTPEDYVRLEGDELDALAPLFEDPTYVLRHDPYLCPGNPCSDPEEGAQAYNQYHSRPRVPERLEALLRRAQDDIGLCRLIVKIHDAPDGNECLRLAIEAGEGGVFDLRNEIQAMPASTYLALRNQVICAYAAS